MTAFIEPQVYPLLLHTVEEKRDVDLRNTHSTTELNRGHLNPTFVPTYQHRLTQENIPIRNSEQSERGRVVQEINSKVVF